MNGLLVSCAGLAKTPAIKVASLHRTTRCSSLLHHSVGNQGRISRNDGPKPISVLSSGLYNLSNESCQHCSENRSLHKEGSYRRHSTKTGTRFLTAIHQPELVGEAGSLSVWLRKNTCNNAKSLLSAGYKLWPRRASGRRKFSSTSDRPSKSRKLQLDIMDPVKTEEIKKFLTDNDIVFSDGYTCLVTSCPRHVRRRIKLKELDKLYINMKTGFFVCHSCKKSGSWSQLQGNIENLLACLIKSKKMPPCFEGTNSDVFSRQENEKAVEMLAQGVKPSSLSLDSWELLQEDLNFTGLSIKTLEKYGVKVTPDHQGLIFPSYNIDGTLVGVKVISMQITRIGEKEKRRIATKTIPRTEYQGLFGLKQVPAKQTEVVLTASELDALAVVEGTGHHAIALPKGDSNLPQQVLPLLEQFKKIVIWLGGNMKVWSSAKHFARKLDDTRCHLVRPEEKSPNALKCLHESINLQSVLKSSRALVHQSIITFGNIRQEVFTELTQADMIAGVQWMRYPQLTKLLRGHRRGEMTVFTGPTGAGKTTFISEYSLDLCLQGVNTLWGSFEINNVRLMKTMLTQYARTNLTKQMSQFEHWADQFESLPMYFMTFHGQENITKVIETMSHAVYAHDISHVVVDNLQFMMGVDSFAAFERFHKQDQVISSFRKFATNMNCHVTLVIHPRKEKEEEDLTLASIFGSARASQEADNVLILQNRRLVSGRGRKFIQVAKNRYNGELGVMLLKFNRETLTFSSNPKDQKEDSKESKTASAVDAKVSKRGKKQTDPDKYLSGEADSVEGLEEENS